MSTRGRRRSWPPLEARELVHAKESPTPIAETIREYAFHHQILHQVTYDTVLKTSVKRQAHARTADWLAHHAGAVRQEPARRRGRALRSRRRYRSCCRVLRPRGEHMASIPRARRRPGPRGAGSEGCWATDESELRWRLLANRERVLDLMGRREAQLADIEALQALAEAMPPGVEGDTRHAEVAWRRADHAHRIGDWETQEREARRTQSLAERTGDPVLALRSIHRLAPALAFRGDAAAGRALAEAGLARARALGLPREESRLLNALTVCTDMLGEQAAGLRYSLLDLELNRATGHRVHEAVALSNVGMSYLGFGAFEEARRHLHEALRLNRAMGNREVEGNCLSMLSELEWRERNHALASSHAQAAYAISIEVDSRLHQADSLWSLGNAELALGRWDEAVGDFERSEALARAMELTPQVLNALDGRARVALARGDTVQARRLGEQLLAEAEARAGADAPSTRWLGGTYEHLIRLTLHQAFVDADGPRADCLLARRMLL
jgi:tetratricopeptide (TPR) repeat protein